MPKKQKILFYSGHCEIVGGDAKYLFDLINSISKESFEIVLCTDENHVFEQRKKQQLRKEITVAYLPTYPRLFEKSLIRSFLSAVPALRFRGKSAADIAHYFYKTLSGEWIRGMFRNYRIFSKVFQAHADASIFHFNNGGYPGKEAGFVALCLARKFGIKSIVMTVHNVPGSKSRFRPVGSMIDWIVRTSCTKVIAASDNIRKELIEKRGLPAALVETIYCGMEDAALLSDEQKPAIVRDYRLPEGKFLLGICGQFDEDRKGHLVLLDALGILAKKHSDIALVVVGSGSAERLNLLKRHAAQLGIDANIHFLGYQEAVHSITSLFDVAIVPSTSNEATPYTIKEAARAGVPVITTTAGGCAAAVNHGQTGFAVEPNNPEQLAEAIEYLKNHEQERAIMGIAARRLFLERFLLNNKIMDHLRLYAYPLDGSEFR